MSISAPVVIFPEVFHWGHLDPCHRPSSYSYEGSGVSVSRCPEAWQQIAKLGGNPLQRLTKPGGRFLDMTALRSGDRDYLLDMARRSGRLIPVEVWKVTTYDEELDCYTHSLYWTHEEAEREIDDIAEGYVAIFRTNSHTTGPSFRYAPARENMGVTVEDIAILEWLEDETDLDGAWWFELYAPDSLSAPRGVIFPSRLSSWTAETADTDIADDNIPDIFEHDRMTIGDAAMQA